MGRSKAVAVAQQAQAQQQANISKQESLELVQCLLRVSIMQVSYLRGLFNDAYFNELHMDNLDGMNIKTLKPIDEESTRLIDWVEQGVADALKEGYIKNLFFGISSDVAGDNLLEEYIYTFTYGEDGQAVGIDFTSNAKGKKSGKLAHKAATVDTVRYEVCRLIRMLVEISQTLDKVPPERFLFMKLTYTDSTPDEYEPPMFQAMDTERLCRFKSNPFRMFVGGVNTQHHCVKLSVKSILDACGDDYSEGYAEDEEEMEGSHMLEGSQQPGDSMMMDQEEEHQAVDSCDRATAAAAKEGRGEQAAVQSAAVQPGSVPQGGGREGGVAAAAAAAGAPMPKPAGTRLTQEELKRRAQEDMQLLLMTEAQPADDPAFPAHSNDDTQLSAGAAAHMAADDDTMDMEAEQQLPLSQPRAVSEQLPTQQRREVFEALRAFCQRRRRVDLDDACLQFPEAPMALLDGALQELVEEGVLQVGAKRGEFLVVPAGAQGSSRGTSVQPEGLANQLTGLTVGGGVVPPGVGVGMGAKVDGSIMGRVQSTHAGSELTLKPKAPVPASVASGAAAAAEDAMVEDDADDQAPPPTQVYFDSSQQSHAAAANGASAPSRPRKASYVATPIHQSMKKKGTTPSKASGKGGRTGTVVYTRSNAAKGG